MPTTYWILLTHMEEKFLLTDKEHGNNKVFVIGQFITVALGGEGEEKIGTENGKKIYPSPVSEI